MTATADPDPPAGAHARGARRRARRGAALAVSLLSLVAACSRGGGAPTTTDAASAGRVGFGIAPGSGLGQAQLTGSTCRAFAKPASQRGEGLSITKVFAKLANRAPVVLVQPPGAPGKWTMVDLSGTISMFPAADDVAESQRVTLLDLTGSVYAENEAGLLSFAYDPDYATSRQAYITYTSGTAEAIKLNLARLRAGADDVFAAKPEVLLQVDAPNSFHLGGHIAFGPDGMLYFGLGFGGTGHDAERRAQNVGALQGKMLRLDVRGLRSAGLAYGIPADNPYLKTPGARGEIFARGFRNPWRWSFDATTGVLWAGDVGKDRREEVDIVRAGRNYGWPVREGDVCNTDAGADPCTVPGQEDPVFTYGRDQGGCITGGYVYRGRQIPALRGLYIFTDCTGGTIWSLRQQGHGAPQVIPVGVSPSAGVTAMAQDAEGELYLISRDSLIYKLEPPGEAPPPSLPSTLSATGCVSSHDASQPTEKLVPYDVKVQFWSDRAAKDRWVALPTGGRLEIDAEQNIKAPPGTVFVKRFARNHRWVETRLFMRYADGTWGGYSYAWNDAAGDATLVPAGGMTKDLGDGTTWNFPARGQCNTCHSEAAGMVLGMQVAQINHDVTSHDGARSGNQVAGLLEAGVMSTPGPWRADAYAAHVDVADAAADLDLRARTYLAVNCSSCHRPGGQGLGGMDFRLSTGLAAMNVCNRAPGYGDFAIADAKLLVQGSPEKSIMSVRMHRMDGSRMPAVSSNVVDEDGVHLIDAWIGQRAQCP